MHGLPSSTRADATRGPRAVARDALGVRYCPASLSPGRLAFSRARTSRPAHRDTAIEMSIKVPGVPEEAHSLAAVPTGDRPPRPPRWIAVAVGAVAVLLLAAETASGWHVLHSATDFYTALAARKYVWANAAAAALIAVVAIFAPGRWRWLAVAGPAAYLAAILIATATAGGAGLAMVMAVLTMSALWDTGERMLRRLQAISLSRNALIAWLAGIGPWGLATILLGRISLVKWWTLGILVIVVGAIGLVRLLRMLLARRGAIAQEIGGSTVGLVSSGLILLTAGWAAIYTAAPEIQYDALYGKASLPEMWARTGHIGSLVQHVQFEITGWFQVLATLGHLFGATAIGRYLQLVGLFCAAAALWWWGRRYGALGPLAAVAVVVTPQIFWQTSTADDDLLLALCALAMTMAVVDSIDAREGPKMRGLAFALGLMAGSGASLKLHLVPLFAFLMLGWIVAGRRSNTILRRLGYSALGAAITALPPLILRWIDSGNPLLPAYNNIFHSKYWLPINEQVNFPFWMHPGSWGPVRAVWKAVVEPQLMAEVAPPGEFGVLVGAVVLALLLGWLSRGRDRASRVIWFALVPALIVWWVSLRYLRYLLPIGFVSIALVFMLTRGTTLGRRGRGAAIAAIVLATAASFPVTISQFWNVPAHKPPVYAAIGRWSASSYESDALPERQALLAFNRLSPPDAHVATSAYERGWLTGNRDLYNLHYEPVPLMELRGPLPKNGDQALADLKRIGIGWMLVTEGDRLQNEPEYISQVITSHGQIEYSARGWDLYRLVPRPRKPAPETACDRAKRGVPACWGGPRTPTDGLAVSVTRVVPACGGQTIVLDVTQAGGTAPSPVLVHFNGGAALVSTQPGEAVPGGLSQRIYATAPPGTTSADVVVSPSPGSEISSATIGRLGPGCSSG
jgi:hypothetical protein